MWLCSFFTDFHRYTVEESSLVEFSRFICLYFLLLETMRIHLNVVSVDPVIEGVVSVCVC